MFGNCSEKLVMLQIDLSIGGKTISEKGKKGKKNSIDTKKILLLINVT